MDMKRCLFCDGMVPIQINGENERFVGCSCAPGDSYSLQKESYDKFHALSYSVKRQMFPIISAYIRERSDCDETVMLSFDDLERIEHLPSIPVTIEQKGERLLQHLYRHSDAPGHPVVIHKLSDSYNLTYSLNLQELVYIIERLKEELMIERIGTMFKLTQEGWDKAAALSGAKRLKPCLICLDEKNVNREVWMDEVLPRIEECGYSPLLSDDAQGDGPSDYNVQTITDSKLVVADLTGQSPEVFFAAGLALGLQIPVIWTVQSQDAAKLPADLFQHFQPFVWDNTEELADMVQRRLTS
ncbi:hypothetical protein [Paenibacillus nasutitermitis]|uniref:Nucleoside 2-deoxyribosyltransferase n=1 Tax=Paenibacillus nasutitermitis TaxID=1652958 RepID=A0A916YWG2_9BACL|nr:hypothetical protein [Paenibacillus nasutitermitis]GGD63015.1 hypothetical protein GCM10010911_21010 [Paenibacillus nasutitermitis]